MTNARDVIVVGARPAGAATALLLARLGHQVIVLDRSAHGSDTLSTHALMRGAVRQLARWDLLDRLVDVGTPPLRRVTFRYGGRPPVVIDLDEPLYAPRRTVLDPLLADAAVASGVEVLRGVHVTGLVRDATGGDTAGRVRGVRLRCPDGTTGELGAGLVVGADGRTSLVGREVAPTVTWSGTSAASVVYRHVRGLGNHGLEWLYGRAATAGIIPTNDDLACVFVGTTPRRFHAELRRDPEDAFDRILSEVSPSAAARVRASEVAGPLRGFPGVPGWLRRPHGPGWALVGDAGCFKDPATAHGITDALRDAELLARAVDAVRRGPVSLPHAMSHYEHVRDHLVRPLLAATETIAAFDWTLDTLGTHHRELSVAMQAEVAHLDSLGPIPAPALAV